MRTFEIIDDDTKLSVGTLLYYDRERTFIIELEEYLDEWNAPLLLTAYVKKGIFSIPRDISLMWVKERIIPGSRQNIASILTNHRLKSYDEMKFLELSEGRCSQDNMFIRKTDKIPDYVIERMEHNLLDCTPLEGWGILCFFKDGITRKIQISELEGVCGIDKVAKSRLLFDSCTLGTDGFYLTFNNSIDIPAWSLRRSGKEIELSYEDFISFTRYNIKDTTSACRILECSRQNLNYMTKQNMLLPVTENVRGNLYLTRDVLQNTW